MKLELTKDETMALVGLIDAGVRATGLRSIKEAAGLIEKIEAAQAETPSTFSDESESKIARLEP